MNSGKTEKLVGEALKIVADKNGVDLQEVRLEIERALAVARENPNPTVQAFWKGISNSNTAPTLEEVIAYIAAIARRATR